MSDEVYIPEQSFTFDNTLYRAGRPMPMEVAREHGLVDEDSDGENGDQTADMGGPLPDDFPWKDNLAEAGYETIGSVAEATVEDLVEEVNQVGEERAVQVKQSVNDLLAES